MKQDAEVLLMLRERARGRTQVQAAARSGMSVRTVRNYERRARLPSQLTQPRTYRSRPDPFAEDWPWLVKLLEDDPALQGQTLFGLLCDRHPGRYQQGQLRTLQRHIAGWRAQYGPEREVIFPQIHEPGEAAQSDFTHMSSLGVTLGGVPFPHLVYHLVLVYSNIEAVQICFSESFESLVEGFERCIWQVGGVPRQHRTDHLGAAIHPLDAEERGKAKERYRLLMAHYGLEPTTNNLGVAHENGDVEQEHRQFKRAVDQALRARGSREFADRAAYNHFLQNLVKQRNLRRQERWLQECEALRPLPMAPLELCREVRTPVSRFSTIQVLRNTYSVPSRLIGSTLLVRVHSETLEVYRATTHLLTMPRLLGTGQHRIDYRHVIWSLVRKPGAFAHYRYRDDLFPSLTFRRAYDALRSRLPERADRHYVRLLHLAAGTAESEVEAALGLLLDQGITPTFDGVRDLVRTPSAQRVPELSAPVLDLSTYDRLLTRTAAHA
ncbi:MAG TPA: IS21 family transposase [Castellaniella sp.]|jgi:transcriptional regulator with XRE-family HTH domain|nr:IS21 family transposase [Castellaniella sp.]